MKYFARILAILAGPTLALGAVPVAAQEHAGATTEWAGTAAVSRYVSPQHRAVEATAIAAFGPFRVVDAHTVALVDITDGRAPAQFAALLAAYPEIEVLEFIEAPGTDDDLANFEVARMLRRHGIATRAPAGGSVRSGAVELFLAGVSREIDADSEFAVHGWIDDRGLGADDYPANAPEHRRYLDYYVEVGMVDAQARAFYAMTNSVPFEDALWLTGEEMQVWLGVSATSALASDGKNPDLARLDFAPVLQ